MLSHIYIYTRILYIAQTIGLGYINRLRELCMYIVLIVGFVFFL
jgi:hypothetical protein